MPPVRFFFSKYSTGVVWNNVKMSSLLKRYRNIATSMILKQENKGYFEMM